MKHVLLLLTICLGGFVNAQTSFRLASNEPMTTTVINQQDYEYVQKIISQKPIHVHPDSTNRAFTICWNGPETTYTIFGPNKKKIKSGKIVNSVYIKTKRWKPGVYILNVGEYSDVLVLMRK